MNHPDWPAFLAAICAEPDDDTLRLVAADFLDENGEPDRAAFVRAHVELARLEASGLMKSRAARSARGCVQKYLGTTSGRAWAWAVGDCPELVNVVPSAPARPPRRERTGGLEWGRGFVELIDGSADAWLRHGAAVRKCHPVRYVVLRDCRLVAPDTWAAHLDALRGLCWVDVSCGMLSEDERLADWLRPLLPGTDVTYIPF